MTAIRIPKKETCPRCKGSGHFLNVCRRCKGRGFIYVGAWIYKDHNDHLMHLRGRKLWLGTAYIKPGGHYGKD